MTQATMFLSQLTILDHAYIDECGVVVGGSFNPDFLVGGDVDPIEQVVVDFSTVKKDLKGIIDHKEIGFDHKLWFIEGYSQGHYEEYINDLEQPRIRITTMATYLDVPRNAVTIFAATEYSIDSIGTVLGEFVEAEMRKKYPTVRITCFNNTKAHTPTLNTFGPAGEVALFTYSHGLKDSTSWGCNNIAHGHLSYVQIHPQTPESVELQDKIAKNLDGVVFVNRSNVTSEDETQITLEYTTGRGLFMARYKKGPNYLIVLDTETTIEHLVEYVRETNEGELRKVGARFLFVSEGLSKGAVAAM